MPQLYAIGLIVVLISFLAFAISVRRIANRRLEPLVTCTSTIKGGNSLVVLVHGTQRTSAYFDSMRAIVEDVRPDADILFVQYPSGVLSNADPFLISEQMCRKIREAHDRGRYGNIILVGYSKGALLVRKAFVYGHGRIEDLEFVAGEKRDPMPWVGSVERLVLLAGMNRGWTLRHRPKQMSRIRFWRFRQALRVARLTGTCLLTRRCESGEPFVANLRIQWLDLMRGIPASHRPTVIQLLGDRDDVVSSEDQRDVTVARDFIWVPVSNTGHADIIDLADPISGAERRSKIKMALGNEPEIQELRRLSTRLPDNQDPLVQEVVVVLHGIRDMAAWTSQFEAPLKDAYQAKGVDRRAIQVTWPSYGYFGMGPFLLWADRQANVRWFMDEFTEIKARYPNLQKVHFIGHSNGTYVLGSALKNYRTLRVGNIAFAGCVLRRDFDWDRIGDQFEKVRNFVAARDWVVAWFPRLFEFSFLSFMNRDIGSAGFNGFTRPRGNALETRFLNGAHGIGLDRRNMGSIVEFIIHGTKTDEPTLLSASPTWRMEYSSKFCGLIWLLIVVLVAIVFVGWLALFNLILALMPALQPFRVEIATVTYAALVLALLNIV
jgi:predicted esterase